MTMKTLRAVLTAALLALPGLASADSNTPRFNLVKPSTGSLNWGAKLNSDFDVIDSSAAALRQPNTFLSSNTMQAETLFSSHAYITNGSSVGIRTITPTDPLQVVGTVRATSLKADLADNGMLYGAGTGGAISALPAMGDGGIIIGAGTGVDPTTGTISGTANRVTATRDGQGYTLSAPQDLHSGATPTFSSMTLNGFLNATSSVTAGIRVLVSTSASAATGVVVAGGAVDAQSYKAHGTAGTSVSCSAGQAVGGASVIEGIVTAGSCISSGGGDAVLSATQTFSGVNTFSTIAVQGHYEVSGATSPTVSSCGTAPNGSIVGTDAAGRATIGGTPTTCTVNFAKPYANPPICVCSSDSDRSCSVSSVTTTSVALDNPGSSLISGEIIAYICFGRQ